MFTTKHHAIVLLFLGMFPWVACAQEASPPADKTSAGKTLADNAPLPAQSANRTDVNSIDSALQSDDNFQVQQALDSAIASLADPKNSARTAAKVPGWLHELIAEKRFDEVEDFAVAVINARPTDLRLIETCQQARIRATLLDNKPRQALPLAKGLYDVCFMADTSRAIDLIAECLYDINADGDPAGEVKKFKLEQIHGAATTQPSGTEDNALSHIQPDPAQYAPGLAHADLVESSWDAAMGKGNLLLLAGQAKEATKVFDKAYALASDNNLAAATEAVARAMRAEDGTVGRANAWILSLRPAEQAAQ
jgi:hypothetical protein